MIIEACEQGTPEWFQARCGAITASNFKMCRERLKSGPNKGDYKAGAHDYAFRCAIERISGESLDQGQYETWAMRRGHELEPEARLKHEARIGMFIEQTGIVLTDDRHFGGSADGFINDDGGAEYKCFVAPDKLRPILFYGDTSEVEDQIQGCMWLTGRKWWDFVLYCPPLESVGLDMTIIRRERNDDYIEALEADLLAFDQLVESYRERIENLNNKAAA